MLRRKIVLIGAGSAVFTQGLVADFILAKDIGQWEIALVDTDQKALESITKLTRKMVTEKNADIIISPTMERKEVLPNADVVVTTIAVGGRRAWENDVFIPRKYGINQPVGDTTMPGGISRALRMIPVMIEIAKDIKELCPDAYFFNYSNPMTAICAAIRKEVGIPVIGLCHGVIHVEQYLARFLNRNNSELKSLGIGLNHLTFLYDLRVNGKDAHPLLLDELAEQKRSQTSIDPETNSFREMGGQEDETPFYGDNPFSWELYEKYHVFPAVLDRHVVEFFPERFASGEYYGKTLGKDAFSFENVIMQGDRTYEDMHMKASGEREISESLFERTEGEHEQLIDILRSLYQDRRKTFYVNLPNEGAVPNLPSNAVLEMPAIAAAKGFIPLYLPDLPELPASLLKRKIPVVDFTVEAALTGDFTLFVEALLADGSVRTEETARKLAQDLIDAQREFLPQFTKMTYI